MQNLKYEITDIEHPDNPNLRRIRALVDIVDVKVGDLGGYVETEESLSHEDSCWIYDDAQVCGFSKVYDDSTIRGNSQVIDSVVSGLSKVSGNSIVTNGSVLHGVTIVEDCIIDKCEFFCYFFAYLTNIEFRQTRVIWEEARELDIDETLKNRRDLILGFNMRFFDEDDKLENHLKPNPNIQEIE